MAGLDLSRVMAKIDAIGEGFANREAKVGFFPGAVYEDGTPVAYVATIHEFGSPEQNIPPRPFMRLTVEDKKAEWSAGIANGMQQTLAGRITADDVLDLVGQAAASDIAKTIRSVPGQWDELSPATLADRKRRGRGLMPLQDSGLLIASIQHQVGDAS
jgi:hypothetical protein